MGGGNKQTTEKTTTDTSKTADPMAAGFFPGLYSAGQGALDKSQATPVPQNFVAGPTGNQQNAISMMLGAAPGMDAVANPLRDMASKVASGYFLDPSNDPTFAGAAGAAINPITRQLREQILPGITHSGLVAGGTGTGPSAFSGSRTGLDVSRALSDWEGKAGDITAGMANASRNAGLALIPQAGGMATAANQLALAPSQVTGQAGTQQQNWDQGALDNLLKRYETNVNAPWAGLQPFANLLTTGGFNKSASTSEKVTTPPDANLYTQLLQGGLGVAGMGASLFGAPAGGTSAVAGATKLAKSLWE